MHESYFPSVCVLTQSKERTEPGYKCRLCLLNPSEGFKWAFSLVKRSRINWLVVLKAPWIIEAFSIFLFDESSFNTPADTDVMAGLLELIGLTEQPMVYLLLSRLKRRQDKSVVPISEDVICCLAIKVRSWIYEPGSFQGGPCRLCSSEDTVGKTAVTFLKYLLSKA